MPAPHPPEFRQRAIELASDDRKHLAVLRTEIRRLEVENEILRRDRGVLCSGERPPKMIYPVVAELAADGIAVAVCCRVLGGSTRPAASLRVGSAQSS
jgi:hypothetical protein